MPVRFTALCMVDLNTSSVDATDDISAVGGILWTHRHVLVHRASWSPRLMNPFIISTGGVTATVTYLTTSVPGMGTASIHSPSAFMTCSAGTVSCQRIVKT